MGQEKVEEVEQLNLSGGSKKIKVRHESEDRHVNQGGKKWTVVILLLTLIASLVFYFFSSGEVRIFPNKDESVVRIEEEKTEDGGIFGPKVYEF